MLISRVNIPKDSILMVDIEMYQCMTYLNEKDYEVVKINNTFVIQPINKNKEIKNGE